MRLAQVMLLSAPSLMLGQSTEGLIMGHVRDRSSHRPIFGARVEALNLRDNTMRQIRTNEGGKYFLPQLPPGSYRLSITAENFQAREVHGLELPVSGYLQIDFDLRPLNDVWERGSYHTVIQRDESVLPFFGPDVDPAYSSHLRPDLSSTGQLEPSVSEVLDPRLIEKLPLAGRDVYSALVLLPGVASDTTTVRSLGLSAAGQRPTSSDFLLDGIGNNNHVTTGSLPLPPEAIQEYRVSTNNFSAEYGGTAGYIANAVTRAAGLRWHGIAYANTQKDALDANTFYHNANKIAKAPFQELQDGVWAGGPLPWKGFSIALAFEYFDSSSRSDPVNKTVPTKAFADSLTPGSSAYRLLQASPPIQFATAPGRDSGPIAVAPPVNLTRYTGLGRLDYQPSGSQHVMLRASPAALARPDFIWTPYGDGLFHQGSTGIAVTLDSAWLPYFTTEIRAGFEKDSLGWNLANASLPSVILSTEGLDLGSMGNCLLCPAFRDRSHASELEGAAVWAQGSHVWKAGGGRSRRVLSDDFEMEPHGQYYFLSADAFRADDPAFAEFQLSRLAYPQALAFATANGRYNYDQAYGYFSDDYRATPHLTLTAGLRYDWTGSPQIQSGTVDAAIQIPAGDPRKNIAVASLAQANGQVFRMNSSYWSARLGLAFAPPLPGRSVTFRAGYGMFHDPLYDNLWSGVMINNLALLTLEGPRCGLQGDYLTHAPNLQQCLPIGGINPFLNLTSFGDVIRLPLVQNFFTGAQWRASRAWSVEVNGLGSSGDHLVSTDVLNRLVQNRRLNTALNNDIYYRANEAASSYGGLTVSARYQARRAAVRLFYTWSHSIDNQSDPLIGDFFDLGFSNQTDRSQQRYYGAFTLPTSRDADKGNSDFDQRHNFVAFSYWEPPALNRWGLAPITRSWQIAETFVVRSGLPFSVLANEQNCEPLCNTRANLAAPNAISSGAAVPGGKILLNAAAFSVPPDGVNGNTGRNAFAGPGFWNMDFSLARTFGLPFLGETGRVQVRADAFNVFNHANLQPPDNFLGNDPSDLNTDFGVAAFGRAGRAGFPALTPFSENSRQLQILVRIQF